MKTAKILAPLCLCLWSLFAGAAEYPTMADLKGNWKMKSAKCTSGKDLEVLKELEVNFQFDEKQLSLQMTDKNGKKDNFFTGKDIFLQEDLLSFSTKTGASTIKVQMKDKKNLSLHIPLLGLAADCPLPSDLQVLNFTR